MKKYKVLFADLDGTLIETLSGETFPKGIWDMKFKFDVWDAIKNLAPKYLFIVSNQGGIEKGFVDETSFGVKLDYICFAINEYVGDYLFVSREYSQTNDPKCLYRKPNTGMLEELCDLFLTTENYPKEDMLMIGDAFGKPGQWSDTDKKTAENFGIDYLDVKDFVELYKK